MQLNSSNSCVLCLEELKDPSRDDELCTECGEISDKYNFLADEENSLNLNND